jgi:uncharacterized small protein (DUF1192 family)
MATIDPEPLNAVVGLRRGARTKEITVRLSDDAAVRYRVVEERLDLAALRREKARLEAQLDEKEPSDEELREWGRMGHPYYARDESYVKKRVIEIDSILRA